MEKEKKKLIILIILVIGFILSATYAYLFLMVSNNTVTGEGGCFEVNYAGQDISSSSLNSTTNYLEGAHSQITLSKNAGCDIYTEAEIYLHTASESTSPLGEAFKYKILNGEDIVSEGSLVDLRDDNGNLKDNRLATVSLSTTDVTYDIYLWIDSDLSNGAYNGTVFSGYLYASATQTSNIKGQ